MAQTSQYCTFYLDKLLFGIELRGVQEVLRFVEMTPVPLAAGEVSGLINLRGQIVTAIDLRRRLELEERPKEMLPENVVVRRRPLWMRARRHWEKSQNRSIR